MDPTMNNISNSTPNVVQPGFQMANLQRRDVQPYHCQSVRGRFENGAAIGLMVGVMLILAYIFLNCLQSVGCKGASPLVIVDQKGSQVNGLITGLILFLFMVLGGAIGGAWGPLSRLLDRQDQQGKEKAERRPPFTV